MCAAFPLKSAWCGTVYTVSKTDTATVTFARGSGEVTCQAAHQKEYVKTTHVEGPNHNDPDDSQNPTLFQSQNEHHVIQSLDDLPLKTLFCEHFYAPTFTQGPPSRIQAPSARPADQADSAEAWQQASFEVQGLYPPIYVLSVYLSIYRSIDLSIYVWV